MATQESNKQVLRSDVLVSLAAFLITLALYVRTAAPTVLMGDSGEFQFAAYLLGIAHPTGYPLYLLLGWAWSHLVIVGDVAYRMNLFSALWGALAVGLLVPTFRLALVSIDDGLPRGLSRAIAFVLALALAFSGTFWSQAVVAEVYSLNSFFVVLILHLLLRWSQEKDERWLLGLAFAYGLSLTHHHSVVLLALGILVFLLVSSQLRRLDLGQLLFGSTLLVLPLMLYLYIPWRAPRTPYLTVELAAGQELHLYQDTFQGLVDFILGRTFEGALDWMGLSLDGLAMAWKFLLQQFGPIGPPLGLVGVGYLFYRRAWGLLALMLLSFVALLVFVLVYRIGDIHDLFTPLYILLALWMAVGVLAITRVASAASGQRGTVISWAVIVATGALPVWLAATQFGSVGRSDEFQARRGWEAMLAQPIPQGAILVSNDRDEIMPLWYLKLVEGVRPDLTGLFPLLTPDPEHANVVRVVDSVLDGERRVYLIKPMPGLELKYRMTPEFNLVRVECPVTVTGRGWRRVGAKLDGEMVLVAYRLEPERVQPGAELEVALHWQLIQELDRNYTSYVHLVDGSGRMVAQSDHLPGGQYYPSSLWRPGEDLADVHMLAIPADLPADSYELEAGMYAQPGLHPLGQRMRLGLVDVE